MSVEENVKSMTASSTFLCDDVISNVLDTDTFSHLDGKTSLGKKLVCMSEGAWIPLRHSCAGSI